MTDSVNTRELILGILMEVTKEGSYSHLVIRSVLDKYQYLEKKERAFITRVSEGTIQYMIELDYIINQFSKVKVNKMKPVICNILRMSVYQLKYMDSVPDSAVCNEAVKLAKRKGFGSLSGFVNGVLRNISRNLSTITYPDEQKDQIQYLSVRYSMPEWIVRQWINDYGMEQTVSVLQAFLQETPVTIRTNLLKITPEALEKRLKEEGVTAEKMVCADMPELNYAFMISGFDHLNALASFREGLFYVQDVSSMLVAEVAAPKKGDQILDLCAAPGGKSLHVADKMAGFGMVEARDLTEYKVGLIQENIVRAGAINVQTRCMDATVLDIDSEDSADIVLADVPCSGYGVIGKKPDIKYKVTPSKQEEIVILQRKILDRAARYVKRGGTLVYSTCTIAKEENQENVSWFLENYPFEAVELDSCLPQELCCETTKLGYLQLLPGVHKTDGFFIAKFKRKR